MESFSLGVHRLIHPESLAKTSLSRVTYAKILSPWTKVNTHADFTHESNSPHVLSVGSENLLAA